MSTPAPADPPGGAPLGPAVRTLHSAGTIRAAVRRLGTEISVAHPTGLVMVVVLKGGVCFAADLLRAISVDVEVDFLSISAYAPGTGRVRIVKDLEVDIFDRDVVIVEGIVDTGLTLGYLLRELGQREPRTLDVCALLDRATRRIIPAPIRHVGFTIGEEFVLGYGLDFAGRYRNLDHLVVGDVAVLGSDPDAYVLPVFGR